MLNLVTNCSIADKYDFIFNCKDQYRHNIYDSNVAIAPFNEAKCLMNNELRKWLNWVNREICLRFNHMNKKTVDVKIRIATGMLNKISTLSEYEKIQIHSNLIKNISDSKIELIMDEIPF